MCTQELMWCSCGHGEFFPIVRCPRATLLGACYIIVHGSQHPTRPRMPQCSYCAKGLNERHPLASARPEEAGRLVAQNDEVVLKKMLADPDYWPDDGEKVIASLEEEEEEEGRAPVAMVAAVAAKKNLMMLMLMMLMMLLLLLMLMLMMLMLMLMVLMLDQHP
jgi:hypothetical protein